MRSNRAPASRQARATSLPKADDLRGSGRPAEVDRAIGALASAAEILLSLNLDAEARDVAELIERLRRGRTGSLANVFRRDGEFRLVLYESDVFRLKETVGLGYLAKLLANPGREIHALDLVGSNVALASDAGPLLDAEARRAYRQRIRELTDDLAETESANDPGRTARHRDELAFLRTEMAAGEGLAGRERPSASTSERARQAATKALKSALGRIARESPALARHLASTVRTGTYCRYDPDPRLPVGWRF
jgi:hypothetical protein